MISSKPVTTTPRIICPSRVLGDDNVEDRHVFYFVRSFRWSYRLKG